MPAFNSDTSVYKLETGRVYLTLGTYEQVRWILKHQGLEFAARVLYEPTTKEITEALSLPNYDDTDTAFYIYPKPDKEGRVKGTGLIKPSGKSSNENDYALPNDQFFTVNANAIAFVFMCDITGETPKELKDDAKKLAGGCYEILDLNNFNPFDDFGHKLKDDIVEFNYKFPVTTGHKIWMVNAGLEDPSLYIYQDSDSFEQRLVKALLTKEGVIQWGSLTRRELVNHFLVRKVNRNDFPVRHCALLVQARAWCLLPWLLPFITLIEEHYINESNPGAILIKFAAWVYMSTHIWSTPYASGLYLNKPRKQDAQPYWVFKPSERAKAEWLKITGVNKVK